MTAHAPRAASIARAGDRTATYDALIRALLMLDRRVGSLWAQPHGRENPFAREVQRRFTINCLRELESLLRKWIEPDVPGREDASDPYGFSHDLPAGSDLRTCHSKLRQAPGRCTPADIAAVVVCVWRQAHAAHAYHGCILLAAPLR